MNAFVSGGFLPPAVRGTKLTEKIHIVDWCQYEIHHLWYDIHNCWPVLD